MEKVYKEYPNTDAGRFQEAQDRAAEKDYTGAQTCLGCLEKKESYRQRYYDFFCNVNDGADRQHFEEALIDAAASYGNSAKNSLLRVINPKAFEAFAELEKVVYFLQGAEHLDRAVGEQRVENKKGMASSWISFAVATFNRSRPEGSNRFIAQPQNSAAKSFDYIVTRIGTLLSGNTPNTEAANRLIAQAKKRFVFPTPQADK